MGIEHPNFIENEVLSGNEPLEESGNDEKYFDLKSKIKKAVAIGATAAAVFGGEGCKPVDNASSNQEFAKEALKVLKEANQENVKSQEKFLSGYFYNLERPTGEMYDVLHSADGIKESQARAWDIVKKKGFFKNGADGKVNIEFKRIGLVPVEIKVNGEFVPVGSDDYTKEELGMTRRAGLEVEDVGKFSLPNSAVGENEIGSDERKPFVSSGGF